jgi:transposase
MKFKWLVGVDISKKTLDVTLYNSQTPKNSCHIKISNDLKGFNEILHWIKKNKLIKEMTIFCMEHTGVYGVDLANFLEKKKMSYSMISPLHIKRSLGLTRGKNDKVDSYQISRFAYIHREELRLTKLPTEALKNLRCLMGERERLVKVQTSEKQVLKELRKVNIKSTQDRIKARIALYTKDICLIEEEIEQIIKTTPDVYKNYELIRSVVGIGLVNAVLFIVYSNNFHSFLDARKYECYSGVAPFENTSGTSIRGKTRVSHLANKRLKANLSNGARSAVQNDPELRLYYNRKMKEGKEHGIIMNAIKFKLITRVFAVVQRGTPYVRMRKAG